MVGAAGPYPVGLSLTDVWWLTPSGPDNGAHTAGCVHGTSYKLQVCVCVCVCVCARVCDYS